MFQWPFSHESEVYAIMFPKFLFPVNNIIFNSSIFLTIVIAYERYLIASVVDIFHLLSLCPDLSVCAAPTNTATAPWEAALVGGLLAMCCL